MTDPIEAFYDSEDAALHAARVSVMGYPPHSQLPEPTPHRLIDDYKTFLAKPGVSRVEGEFLATHDLILIANAIRSKVFGLSGHAPLNVARHAVLLHVAYYLGPDRLKAMDMLWEALGRSNYEQAADELLFSAWPIILGPTDHAKRRVADLLRQLRTGVVDEHAE